MHKNAYRQGIIKTKDHLIFQEGQVVNIIREENEFYFVVAIFPNAPTVRILKKYVETN